MARHVRSAFTLLETLIVMTLIGAMMGVIFKYVPRQPSASWATIVQECNNIAAFARQEALATGKKHRILMTKDEKRGDYFRVERQEKDPEEPTKPLYVSVSPAPLAFYRLPDTVSLAAIYIQGENMLEEHQSVSAHVMPTGLWEPLTLHILRTHDEEESKGTLTLQPFIGTFRFMFEFVKPAFVKPTFVKPAKV